MRQTLSALPTNTSAQGHSLPTSDSHNACVVTSYRRTEGTPVPLARFIAQGPPPGIPTDSPLEVLGQLESMNLL
uniref:Uncharacterized protein n=1 Tax=Romanomermis culicivorax TaxID=13658 RepID=A0A915JP54_ROMCU